MIVTTSCSASPACINMCHTQNVPLGKWYTADLFDDDVVGECYQCFLLLQGPKHQIDLRDEPRRRYSKAPSMMGRKYKGHTCTPKLDPIHWWHNGSNTLKAWTKYTETLDPIHWQLGPSTLTPWTQYTETMHPVHWSLVPSILKH